MFSKKKGPTSQNSRDELELRKKVGHLKIVTRQHQDATKNQKNLKNKMAAQTKLISQLHREAKQLQSELPKLKKELKSAEVDVGKTQKGVAILTKAASQAAKKVTIQDMEKLAEENYALGKAHGAALKPETEIPSEASGITVLPSVPTIYPEVNHGTTPSQGASSFGICDKNRTGHSLSTQQPQTELERLRERSREMEKLVEEQIDKMARRIEALPGKYVNELTPQNRRRHPKKNRRRNIPAWNQV